MNGNTQYNKPASDDWRRQGQENYLKGVKLVLTDYSEKSTKCDHDHCEFCAVKFSMNDGDLRKGYSTEDNYRWICVECYDDFKEEFSWQILDET